MPSGANEPKGLVKGDGAGGDEEIVSLSLQLTSGGDDGTADDSGSSPLPPRLLLFMLVICAKL